MYQYNIKLHSLREPGTEILMGRIFYDKRKTEKNRVAEMKKDLDETLNYCKETKIAIAELKSVIEVIKKSINRSGKLN